MVDILREVEEDLRRERYQKLWNEYGVYAIGVVAALLLAVAGSFGWRAWVESRQLQASFEYEQAVEAIRESNTEPNRQTLENLALAEASGYGLLARFQEAAALEDAGERPAALAIYQSIYEHRGTGGIEIPQAFKDVARIYAGLTLLGGGAWEAVETALRPLADSQRAGRLMAGEILALAAIEQGYRDDALEFYRRIPDEEDASPYLKERAKALLRLFEYKPEEEEQQQ